GDTGNTGTTGTTGDTGNTGTVGDPGEKGQAGAPWNGRFETPDALFLGYANTPAYWSDLQESDSAWSSGLWSTSSPHSGRYCHRSDKGSSIYTRKSDALIPTSQDDAWTLSFWVRATNTDDSYQVNIEQYNAVKSDLSLPLAVAVDATTTATSWEKYTVSFGSGTANTFSASVAFFQIHIYNDSGSAGDYVYFDDIMVTPKLILAGPDALTFYDVDNNPVVTIGDDVHNYGGTDYDGVYMDGGIFYMDTAPSVDHGGSLNPAGGNTHILPGGMRMSIGAADTGNSTLQLYITRTKATTGTTSTNTLSTINSNTATDAGIRNTYGMKTSSSDSGTASVVYGMHGSAYSLGTAGYGLYGYSYGAATTNYGIYGVATGASTNWAGYFEGAVAIEGTLYFGASQDASISRTSASLIETPQSIHAKGGTIYFGTTTDNFGQVGMGGGNVLNVHNDANGAGVSITADNASDAYKTLMFADPDGAATIYYAGNAKIATSNTGITVTGSTSSTGDSNTFGNTDITDLDITDTTAATSSLTGALTVAGGIGVDQQSYFGDDVWINGTSLAREYGLSLQAYYVLDNSSSRVFWNTGEGTNKQYGMSWIMGGNSNPIFDGTTFTNISDSGWSFLRHQASLIGTSIMSGTRSSSNVVFSGNVDINGDFTARKLHYTHHTFSIATTAKRYIPFNSISEQASPNYYTQMIAPYGGHLLRVRIRSNVYISGTTYLRFHKQTGTGAYISTAATETENMGTLVAGVDEVANFASSTFVQGEPVGLSITMGAATTASIQLTAEWRFDET
ncbi:MAG: hypothetical protein H8D23_17850, partial [Candidatus Brocadiales bacterium]|nr:hypothetical protein [Candidatus Brocadiales bacterium]